MFGVYRGIGERAQCDSCNTALRKSLPILITLNTNGLGCAVLRKCCDRATPE